MNSNVQRADILRFDPLTNAYGVIDKSGVLRTYFKPLPCSAVPAAQRLTMRHSGRCHGYANNLLYFEIRMQEMVIETTCPVCGYEMDDPPRDYNICPSCGTEFGLHDVNASISELRAAWLQTGP